MKIQEEDSRRRAFREMLFSLAESQNALESKSERVRIYKKLEEIYYISEDGTTFKHFYSDIFSVLSQIKQEDHLGSIDILGQNIAEIRKGYKAMNRDSNGKLIDIHDSIRKLYDHLSLDIARMGYSDANDRKLSQGESIAELAAQVNKLKKESETISSQVDKVENQLADLQKEHITILGIFASIVLAFTGGLAFSSSVLENLHKASIYRVVVVSLIIGLILVNILFGLFYYIDRLATRAKAKKILPLVIANAVIILLILLTVLCWWFRVVEKRNSACASAQVEITIMDCAAKSPKFTGVS